jgi:DNA-binding NarL/FixJ family response regulator
LNEIPRNLTMEQAALYQGERPTKSHKRARRGKYPKPSDALCLKCLTRNCEHIKPPVAPRLTRRDIAILLLLTDGHSNKEVAVRMGITDGGMKSTTSAIYRKFLGSLPNITRVAVAIWVHDHRELLEALPTP